jgi:hypothetical protein
MTIGKRNRENLRNHRRFILTALEEYTQCVSDKLKVKHELSPVRILKSVMMTHIRVPKNILPDEFIQLVLAENDRKKYQIEFCQNSKDYVYIILRDKPLTSEGQSILFFIFMKLIRHLDNMSKTIPRK